MLARWVEVKADRVFESSESAVVEKCGLQGNVPNRRGAKHIAIVRVARHLFQAEVFILSGSVEGNITSRRIADLRCNLRHADDVLSEVAKHFIRLS